MDARGPCPDSALLAAFLDGTLVGYERTAVVEHLADCAQCRAVAVTVVEFREVQALDQIWDHETLAHEAPAPAHTRIARWARRKTRAPSFAAAALIPFTVVCLLQYLFGPSYSSHVCRERGRPFDQRGRWTARHDRTR